MISKILSLDLLQYQLENVDGAFLIWFQIEQTSFIYFWACHLLAALQTASFNCLNLYSAGILILERAEVFRLLRDGAEIQAQCR